MPLCSSTLWLLSGCSYLPRDRARNLNGKSRLKPLLPRRNFSASNDRAGCSVEKPLFSPYDHHMSFLNWPTEKKLPSRTCSITSAPRGVSEPGGW